MFAYGTVEQVNPLSDKTTVSYVMMVIITLIIILILLLGFVKLIKECLKPSKFKFQKSKDLRSNVHDSQELEFDDVS